MEVVIKIGKDCEYNTTSITGMLDALYPLICHWRKERIY